MQRGYEHKANQKTKTTFNYRTSSGFPFSCAVNTVKGQF